MHSAQCEFHPATKDEQHQNVIQQQLALYLQMQVLRKFAESVTVMVKYTP
jgi:hypothetical protein